MVVTNADLQMHATIYQRCIQARWADPLRNCVFLGNSLKNDILSFFVRSASIVSLGPHSPPPPHSPRIHAAYTHFVNFSLQLGFTHYVHDLLQVSNLFIARPSNAIYTLVQ
jgi:hypothetical protein